ncbi:MAG: PTS glucose transporter subunit IIA [Mycoplasmataceae bacterium]|jgi:glucose-specific phosphotransferase system IIA component|nr:PTS glucose transporter subunit IIA [Mycoplasmataceae bacterium]
MGFLDIFRKKKKQNANEEFIIVSPVAGEIVPTASVPDEAFSTNAMGKGFAVIPSDDTFCAPISGVITLIAETGHAFSIKSKEGYEVLVHIGVDTVNININKNAGEPLKCFTILAKQGHEVVAGTPIVKADLKEIKEKYNLNTITPVILLANDLSNNKTVSEPLVSGVQPLKTVVINIK